MDWGGGLVIEGRGMGTSITVPPIKIKKKKNRETELPFNHFFN